MRGKGSAADLMKVAMLNIHARLARELGKGLGNKGGASRGLEGRCCLVNMLHDEVMCAPPLLRAPKHRVPKSRMLTLFFLRRVLICAMPFAPSRFEVADADLDVVARAVKEEMEAALKGCLHVPLSAELKAGKKWGSMRPYSPKWAQP